MGEIISIVSQKGGVGKTTTAINLCASLATMNHRVLLLDLDPQGHVSASFGYDRYDLHGSIGDVVCNAKEVENIIHQTQIPDFDFIPYQSDMEDDEKNSYLGSLKDEKLKIILNKIQSHYDFIFIDCPPSLNNVTYNALIASDSVIVPVQCEYYALKALGILLKRIQEVKKQYNPRLQYRGFLLTMVDLRNNLSKRVMLKIRTTLKELVFETMIPRNIRLAEVPYYGKPAIMLDRTCKGSQSYLDFAKEILGQNGTSDSCSTRKKYENVIY